MTEPEKKKFLEEYERKSQEFDRMIEKKYGVGSYYDGIPPYINEMTPEELDVALEYEKRKFKEECGV
jgi:hypothetical protein